MDNSPKNFPYKVAIVIPESKVSHFQTIYREHTI